MLQPLVHAARRLVEVDGPLGVTFDSEAPGALVLYILITMAANVLPIPTLASIMCVVGVLLYGWLFGFMVNILAAVAGCYGGLLVCRAFRPVFLQRLGRQSSAWQAVDGAIAADGYKIPLLLRLTPVLPPFLTNALLSLTSIDAWTYLWTTAVGFVPASAPYAYGAVVGEQVLSEQVLSEFPPQDPLLLSVSLIGLAATVLAVVKIGSIASAQLSKAGVMVAPTDNNECRDTARTHGQVLL
tara:strand:- start:360 stop:1082 length:723 start_codon:yes stop_codon:yes gene_type:complete